MQSPNPLVFIAGPFNAQVMAMFFGMGYRGTNDLMMADLVCFTGGADISPSLYGHKPIKECGVPSSKRDALEVKVFESAKGFGIPMVGICRGAQLLNVMNGGTLFQHVDGHGQSHWIADTRTNQRVNVTSTHHQMMIPSKKGEIIAIACPAGSDTAKEVVGSLSSIKKGDRITAKPKAEDYDTEVVWYDETQCLCFQPHPEYSSAVNTRGYFVELLAEFIQDADKEKAA